VAYLHKHIGYNITSFRTKRRVVWYRQTNFWEECGPSLYIEHWNICNYLPDFTVLQQDLNSLLWERIIAEIMSIQFFFI